MENLMIFGLAAFNVIHTALSLIAIVAGAFAVAGLFGWKTPRGVTTLFLATAAATSTTGFGFPFNGLLPSHVVGALALLVLAAMLVARYPHELGGALGKLYAAGMVASLYLLYLLVYVG